MKRGCRGLTPLGSIEGRSDWGGATVRGLLPQQPGDLVEGAAIDVVERR